MRARPTARGGESPGPAGCGYGERLLMLEEALERGDARAAEEFSIRELWDVAIMQGIHDEELEDAVTASELAGMCLMDPDYEQKYGPGGPHADLFEEDIAAVFPEFFPT